MSTQQTRRAVLAGIAAAPALGTAALAATPAGVDPIFAAIERHKITFLASMETAKVRMETVDNERFAEYDYDRYHRAEISDRWACRALGRANLALRTTRPTTMAGVMALLEYVDAFTAGAFKLPSDPENYESGPIFWPSDRFDDGSGVDRFSFDVIANVSRTLQAMAVQS